MAARGGLGSLSVFLGLDTADFTDGLTKAEQQAKRFSDNVKAIAIGQELGRRLGQVADSIGRAFFDMTKGAIDAADHLNDLSKKTGIAVDTLGGIGFAASQAGGDLESATAAAGKLNKSLAEAASGNLQAAEAFTKLGVSVKDANGNTRDAGTVLVDLANKFKTFDDGPEKSALAVRIFGKAGADLIPLLDDGGDALQRNIEYFKRYSGVTQETADAADQFNDTLGKINLLSKAAGTTVASALLPSFQVLADEFQRMKENGDGFKGVAEGVKAVFDLLVVAAANVAFVFLGVGREIGAVAAQLGALASGDIKGFTAIGDAVKEDGVRARAELDRFLADYRNAGQKVDGGTNLFAGQQQAKKGPAPRLSGTALSDGSGELKKILDGQLKTIREFAQQQKDGFDFANRYIEGSYAEGLTSLRDFYASQANIRQANLDAQLEAIDKEVAALTAARSRAPKETDRIDLSNKIAEAEQRRASTIQKATEATILAQQNERRSTEQTADAYDNLRATIAQLTGDDAGAAAVRIGQQVRDAARLITQAGGDSSLAERLRSVLDLQSQAAEQQKAYAKLLDDNARREAEIYLDAQAAGKGELEVLAAVRDARQVAIEQLRSQAAAAAELAAKSGTDADVARANDLALALKKAAAEIDPLAAKFNGLFEDSFGNAFASFLDGTKSAKDAFRDFANSVIGEIARIAAKNLAKSLFGDTGGSSGIGGLLSSLFGGTSGGSNPNYGNEGRNYPQLAVGTNFVPQDGLYKLHKGEAVQPIKYNPAAGGATSGGNVYITNSAGAQVTAQRDGMDWRVMVDAAAQAGHGLVARDVATGTGPVALASRARNGTGSGNLARRN